MKKFKTTPESRAAAARWRLELRTETLMHYSNGRMECACCESKELLVIDHTDGNGKAHKLALFGRSRGISSDRVYSWLRKNNWPEGFQVLCDPCNSVKQDYKTCQCPIGKKKALGILV